MPVRISEMLRAYRDIDMLLIHCPDSVRMHLLDALNAMDKTFEANGVTPPKRDIAVSLGYKLPPKA